MNKSLKRQMPVKTPLAAQKANRPTTPVSMPKDPFRWVVYLVIMLSSFALYWNTIPHDYALDDAIVVTQNQFTTKGLAGIGDILSTEGFTGFFGVKKNLVAGGRYRPMSVVTFAIEYEFFGPNPHVSHFINILLYGLTGIILYLILQRLFPLPDPRRWYTGLPFLTTLLFLAHPIHTEVVANIKGRDEMMSLMGSLLALFYTLRFLDTGKWKFVAGSAIAFFLGLLSKETTITFLVIIPLTVYFFTPHPSSRNLLSLIPLAVAVFIFLGIRQSILGSFSVDIPRELMNNPFLDASASEKYATIFYTLFLYLKLLVFPHPLTFDYYPYHIPIIQWGDIRAILPLVLYIGLAIWALAGIRKKNIYSYAILFYGASLSVASNILFPVGVFMNERFVYASSVGFILALVWFASRTLPELLRKEAFRKYSVVFLFGVFALYGLKTFSRNFAWKNDLTLFTTDVKVSYNSAKSTCSAGGKLIEEAQRLGKETLEKPELKEINSKKRAEILTQALGYLHRSVEIYPGYINALLLLGNGYFENGRNYDSTLYWYKRILSINPGYELAWGNIEKVMQGYPDPQKRIEIFEDLMRYNPNVFFINLELGSMYGKYKNDMPKAIYYLEKASTLNPKNAAVFKDLGVAYGISGQIQKSINALETAVQLDPEDPVPFTNLSVNYKMTGDLAKATQAAQRAQQLAARKPK